MQPPRGGESKPTPSSMEREWIEIDVEYESKPIREGKVPSELQFTDEITFQYTIGVEDPVKVEQRLNQKEKDPFSAEELRKAGIDNDWVYRWSLIEGKVTHMNVYDGPEHFSSMYIHPSVVRRFGGGQKFRGKDTAFVLVELLVKGEVKHSYSKTDWVMRDPEMGWRKFVGRLSGPFLLNKDQTPWAPYYWDTYEMIKPQK